tara:strand:- start:2924 stop:5212 length:2289 start_codon:yes stop_codon:yes gene_type:complete
MSRIQVIYTDRVRYKLSHNPTGTQTVQEPRGWKEDDNEFVRNKTFHGIFPQMTNNLSFFNTGAEFIEKIWDDYGVNADLILIKEERNPTTDIWETSYSGFLDMLTYSKENKGVSIKFISSGLLRVIKARENEKIEIDRTDTLKGLTIPYLEPNRVNLNGRDIHLASLLETKLDESSSFVFRANFSSTNRRFGSLGVPAAITYASDVLVNGIPKDVSFKTGNPGDPLEASANVEQIFYGIADRDRTLTVKIKVSFNLSEHKIDDLSNASMYLRLATYGTGTEYLFVKRENLTSSLISNSSVIQDTVFINITRTIQILEGQSLSLQWYGEANFGSAIGGDGDMDVDFTNIDARIQIDEDSTFNPTVSNVHLPFEVFERYLELFTNQKGLLRSNVLGRTDIDYPQDGAVSRIGMAHGFWIRGFSKDDVAEINEENRYKSMTMSFKDMYSSYFSVWNLGAGIETIGFKEIFRVEELEYFYNRNVLIRLGKVVNGEFVYVKVSNEKRSVDKEVFNSGLEIGYSKGGDYEEAVGLDEYNTKSTFTTIIDKVEEIYTEVSKLRADSYGMEFCRRFPRENHATEDTKYDSSTWLIDMKKGSGTILNQRLWADDFSQAPTGVFSPQTAHNLRLSPFNILLRHGWVIAAGLIKYPLNYIRYGSSVSNSGMKTKLDVSKYPDIGGTEYAENGNIQGDKLETARTNGMIIEFDYEVDYNLLQDIQGKTVILGKEIPNFYGLVEFKNEEGLIEQGYIQKVSPNGAGKWTLKKYNS